VPNQPPNAIWWELEVGIHLGFWSLGFAAASDKTTS
jgi:hypothetical protein